LLNLHYLFDPRPAPLSPQSLYLHLALVAFLALGLGFSILGWRRRLWPRGRERLFKAQGSLSALGLILIGARFLGLPYLSARIWLLVTLLATVGGWATGLGLIAHRRGLLGRQLRLLFFAWSGEERPLPPAYQAVFLAAHLLGLALLATHYGRSYLWALNLLLLLASPMMIYSLITRRWTLHWEALTPLFFLYLVVALHRLSSNLLAIPDPLSGGFTYPYLVNVVFNSTAALIASAAYALLCQLYLVKRGARGSFLALAGVILLGLTFFWAGAEYVGHRTRGVTGSDPYVYAQMAVDLARHGTPWHLFSLFPKVSGLGIAWWPIVHAGYHLPHDEVGHAASVWPAGQSALLAVGYLLLGEEGLYITTPVIGLLSLGAICLLVAEVLHDESRGVRLFAGAWAAFILATSWEQIDRLLVPMADATAQLFTILAMLFTLRAMRGNHRLYALLAGLSFGGAYWVRHTQLVVGLSVLLVVALWGRERSRKEKGEFLLLFGLVSFVMALPDLIYHRLSFGNYLTPESEELALFAFSHLPTTGPRLGRDLFRGNEFGYLVPFLLYGAYQMYRQKRGLFVVLGSWILALVLFHLPYAALRLRDLLSIFPALIALTVYGMISLWKVATSQGRASLLRGLLASLGILSLILLPAYRTRITLARPFGSFEATFGFVTEEERRAFDLLAAYTSSGSVIGTSLNGGPIDLYAGREAFRPESWRAAELDTFLRAMWEEGREIYILDDSPELASTLSHLSTRLIPIVRLEVPVFGERATGYLYRVEGPGSSS